MTTELRYRCNPTEPYSRFELPDWVKQQQAQGKADPGPVRVHVEHPDREADGSCRWCGDTRNETVDIG